MKILKIFENKLRFLNYSEKTINIYCNYLNQFLTINLINDPYQIRTNQIIYYLENYNYISISQQNQIISTLKKFASIILNKKEIHLSKISRPRKERKLPQVIDHDVLINKLNKVQNLKHKTILSLTYSTGLRVSEIVNLKISDIDSKRMLINILQAKGKKDRIVILSENMLTMLRKYYLEYKPKEYLFNGQNSLKYSVRSCQQIFKKYVDSELSIHKLRHSHATFLLECGTNLRYISNLLGHNSTKTTEIYTHVSKRGLANIKTPC